MKAANVWSGDEGWQLLFYYNIYRFGLAIILVALGSPKFDLLTAGYTHWFPLLSISGFLMVSIIAVWTIRRQSPAIHIQAHCLFLLDMLFISIIALSHQIHDANIVVFFITTVGATAIMFRTKTALAYSVIAIFVIYLRDTLNILSGAADVRELYFTALTGLGLFTIVIIVSRIARRTRVVQMVLEKQEMDLADLDDINQIVVDQLEIGILFLEDDLSVKLINTSARELLGEYIIDSKVTGRLADLLKMYLSVPSGKHFSFRHKHKVLSMSTTTMRNGFVVHIEDRTVLSRKIQQTKLSSVGRFASAISHEIRNPLNAINHAAQLVTKDETSTENNELIEIIRKHVRRIDGIIESVLERSQPGRAQQMKIELTPWLHHFIKTFHQALGEQEISISVTGHPITIYFDAVQLDQVLTNLCQNSIQHNKMPLNELMISFQSGIDDDETPFLDVVDNGSDIPDSLVDQLFEPFYTTDSKSTGLGLYLSREFCRLNGADLDYFTGVNHHGFRLTFKLQETL